MHRPDTGQSPPVLRARRIPQLVRPKVFYSFAFTKNGRQVDSAERRIWGVDAVDQQFGCACERLTAFQGDIFCEIMAICVDTESGKI
jgi:hypothetical protein